MAQAVPCFIVNGHDYAPYIVELSPVRNDLDADGSGRDLLSGKMYRRRIAQKDKQSVKFCRLDAETMSQLANDVDPESVNISLLDPKTNTIQTKEYYISTLTYGAQRLENSNSPYRKVYYVGCTFNITEV